MPHEQNELPSMSRQAREGCSRNEKPAEAGEEQKAELAYTQLFSELSRIGDVDASDLTRLMPCKASCLLW
ncbi:hypothetical protein SAMN05216428_102330 [Nitrosospira sp. Nsp11]|nr:hypothetical protein SAMN05216428_102330 [Nitrosospira sp. Nsp11]